MLRRHLIDGAFALGLALLLTLFAAGVIGATAADSASQPVLVRMQPVPVAGSIAAQRGGALLIPGGREREVAAQLELSLPSADPERSRWVLWLSRDPVDAVWLQGTDPAGRPWRSRILDFFHPAPDAATMPTGYMFPLPVRWQGSPTLELHARGAVRVALRPRLMREDEAVRRSHLAIAMASAAYAGLFMLALIVLVLYLVAREPSFIAAFAAAASGLLFLSAVNGHLYQLPGFGLLSGWRSQGLWALLLLFCASVLQLLLRYAELDGGSAPHRRLLERFGVVLVGLAAVCLLDLPWVRDWMQPLTTLAWVSVCIAAMAILVDGIRRGLMLAWPITLLLAITLCAGMANELMQRGFLPDVLLTYYGYQVVAVALLSLLSLGLLSRIGEYRVERDRDQLARQDSERRMQREASRASLTLALQTRLRDLSAGDIEWAAMRLLIEHLQPAVPAPMMAVVAHGYHGRSLVLVEPVARQPAVETDFAARNLALKRLSVEGIPLQQRGMDEHGEHADALLPLKIRAPGWGLLLLRRPGADGFSNEEMDLAAEFARLATLHADEAVAAYQLRRSAELDTLTGCLNRRSIDLWLATAFRDAARREQPLSLLFIDIDRFKGINDRLGHANGDHCLREVATALRQALDADDVLGRYGGEEFVAILPGRNAADARVMGERLRAAVERCEIVCDGRQERVTVSVGVATRLQTESTPATAIERADKALYAAKRSGRNCVQVAPAVFG